MVRTFLKVYMELGSYFLFLQEQMKDIIIIIVLGVLVVGLGVVGVPVVGLGVLGVLVCRPRWRQLQLSSSDSDLVVRLPPAKDVGLVGERKTRGEYRFMKLMK
jgi:hypothetical protein